MTDQAHKVAARTSGTTGRHTGPTDKRRPLAGVVGRINALGMAFIVLLLLLWEAADRLGLITAQFLPRPSEILARFGEMVQTAALWKAIGHTVGVTLMGWTIASTIGILLGSALGLSRYVYRYAMTSIEVLRSLPSIVLLPISVLLFGFSIEMELVLIIFSASWAVVIATIGGVVNTPRSVIESGITLQLGRTEIIRKIVAPSALPSIIVGLRLALSLSLILAVAAEMLGNPRGMGHGLVFEQEALHADGMFVYFLLIGFLGILFNSVFVAATRKIAGRGGPSER
jgi:ABC-type nitrate/sulfonate/bicarbonate transport system permease component